MKNQMKKQGAANSVHELPSHEVLSQLALNEPRKYEALCRELINEFINRAPDRMKPRLLGIQFRVDGMRKLSKSALGSTMRIYEMMWGSFLDLNQNWQEFVHMDIVSESSCRSTIGSDTIPNKSAEILVFRRR